MRVDESVAGTPPVPRGGRRVVNSFRDGVVVFRQMMVRCGKVNCSKCPHGPYWYAAVPNRGKWREVYIGKRLAEKPGLMSSGLNKKLGRLAEREDLLAEAGA